ncbi:MAG TPA: hypothetical protein VFL43_18565 [Variovorax sp.]|nr:hypothetical protein [Variovorax sp.]
MTYADIVDPAVRADLIAYLKQANGTPACAALLTKRDGKAR